MLFIFFITIKKKLLKYFVSFFSLPWGWHGVLFPPLYRMIAENKIKWILREHAHHKKMVTFYSLEIIFCLRRRSYFTNKQHIYLNLTLCLLFSCLLFFFVMEDLETTKYLRTNVINTIALERGRYVFLFMEWIGVYKYICVDVCAVVNWCFTWATTLYVYKNAKPITLYPFLQKYKIIWFCVPKIGGYYVWLRGCCCWGVWVGGEGKRRKCHHARLKIYKQT